MAKPQSHKAQHWVPRCYLAAWADPQAAPKQTPFVHVFSKDGAIHKRKAPLNIFKETDLYTIKMPNGDRDLRLEGGLSRLEKIFTEIRRDFLARRRPLSVVRQAKFLVFVAAMHGRTPFMRDHWAGFWGQVRAAAEELTLKMKERSPAERQRIANLTAPPPSNRPTLSYDDLVRVTDSPMEHLLEAFISAEAPLLAGMRSVVLCTKSDPGFITSDRPVVWFDPEWHRKPPAFRSPSLSDPKLEITMPISPSQLLLLHHGEPSLEYFDAPDWMVSEFNRRTRGHCQREFVCRRAHVEPYWFEMGEVPEDVWEGNRSVAE